MKTRAAVLVALAVAISLSSVAAARPDASKQRVAITTQAPMTTSVSPFVLTPLQAGAVKRDSGTLVASPGDTGGEVMRAGQTISIHQGRGTLRGKLGRLVIRFRSEWFEAGNGYNVAVDTWKVVRGTGQYAGFKGGGRGGSVWNSHTDAWSSRMEGFLTRP